VLPSHIVLAAGGCFALDALVQQLCDPGDGVLIATPYWSGLDISLSVQNEVVVIPVNVPLARSTKAECISHYRKALREAEAQRPVKALLLCNPTNPTGECYSSDTMRLIIEFCAIEELHLISDEVYALSVHGGDKGVSLEDPHSFTSLLSIESSYENMHVIYSLSKDFGCSGIRMVSVFCSFGRPYLKRSCRVR
jgi:aspartate/methionine/tyrosine aminotransferase